MKMPVTTALDTPLTVPPTPECLAGSAAFLTAVQARDWSAVARTLHPSIELHSACEARPRLGEYDVICGLQCACVDLEDVRALSVIGSCNRPVLRFQGTTPRGDVDGVVLLEVDELGLVDRITIMVRPALHAAATASVA